MEDKNKFQDKEIPVDLGIDDDLLTDVVGGTSFSTANLHPYPGHPGKYMLIVMIYDGIGKRRMVAPSYMMTAQEAEDFVRAHIPVKCKIMVRKEQYSFDLRVRYAQHGG